MKQNWKLYILVATFVFLLLFWVYGNREKIRKIEEKRILNESWTVCQDQFLQKESLAEKKKLLFIVTPTYSRPEQIAELTRLLQTLLHIEQVLHWIIVEDAQKCSQDLLKVLHRFSNLSFTVIAAPTPLVFTVSNFLSLNKWSLEFEFWRQKSMFKFFSNFGVKIQIKKFCAKK